MIRLSLLGGLSVESTEGSPWPRTASQRRRLALLAMLAAANDRGLSRDRVLAVLWPESDAEAARHSLSQTLYLFRRAAGGADVVIGTTELRLNRDVVTSDLDDFRRALERGDLERAASLYVGPFLDGFHVAGAPDFERWVDTERARTEHQATNAIRTLASQAEAARDLEAAVRWWRRLVAIAPLEARLALGLITTLAAAGDAPAALAHARVYEGLLRAELGVPPDKSIVDAVESIRRDLSRQRSVATRPPEIENDVATPVAAAFAMPDVNAERPIIDAIITSSATERAAERAAEPAANPRRRRARLLAAALGIGVVIVITLSFATRRFAAADPDSPDRVAIFPFSTRVDPRLGYLREGFADLLSADLDGAGSLHTVDARSLLAYLEHQPQVSNPDDARAVARRFGAGRFVLGSIVEAGAQLRVTASVYDAQHMDEPTSRASASGKPDELFAIVDSVARQLLAERADERHEHLARVAASTTSSLDALKAYLDGEAEFRAGRYDAATSDFRRAVAEDSTFALAYYRLSVAADWNSAPDDLPRRAAEEATRYASRLSEHDRLVLEAMQAWRDGDYDLAETRYRQVLSRHDDDVESWYQLGEVLFHGNPLRGHPIVESRPAFERVLRFDSRNREALIHLARVAAVAHDMAAVDSLTRRAIALAPSGDDLGLRALRAFAAGDANGERQVLAELRKADYGGVFDAAWRVAAYTDDLDGAERIVALLTEAQRMPEERASGHVLLAHLALAHGQWRQAYAELAATEQLMPEWALELEAFFAAMRFSPASDSSLRALRERVSRWKPDAAPSGGATRPNGYQLLPRILRSYLLGMLSARLGDAAAASRYATEVERVPDTLNAAQRPGYAAEIRAYAAIVSGRSPTPVSSAEERAISWPGAREFGRYLRGIIAASDSKDDAALGPLGSFEHVDIESLVFAAPGHLLRARLLARDGDRTAADAEIREAKTLWKHADPEVLRAAEQSMSRPH
jgi:DNA-binding SARP family transcriptional activator/TolB-like protein